MFELGHLVGVFFALDRRADAVGGVHQLAGELLGHALAAAAAGVADDPAARERLPPVVADLNGHLIGGAADPLGLDLEDRGDVADRLVEDVERLLARGAPDLLERVVDDLLGDALLTGEHDAVHELRQSHAPVDRVGQDDALLNAGTAWHVLVSSPSSRAWRRTCCGPACDSWCRRRRACPGSRGSGRRGGRERGHHG